MPDPTGRAWYVDNLPWPAVTAVDVAIVRTRPDKLDSRFLAYFLNSPRTLAMVETLTTGTTRRRIRRADIERLPVPVPSPEEQRRIAGVLGALDDKILHNHKLQECLGSVARNFLNQALRSQGGAWPEVALNQVFDIGIGGVWGKDEDEGSLVPVRILRGIDVHEIAMGGVPDIPLRFVNPEQMKKRALSPGDVLVEASGSFCGRSGMFHPSWASLASRPLLYSNFCKRLVPRVRMARAAIAWLQLVFAYERGDVSRFRTGSAFPNLDVEGLLTNLMVRLPSEAETVSLYPCIDVALDTRLRLTSERLERIRDALLPKLVSGAIRVPDSYRRDDVLDTVAQETRTTAP